MSRSIAHFTVLVPDYDDAIAFYVDLLGFHLVEDTSWPEQDKRWVVVSPTVGGTSIVLARASTPRQIEQIGQQTGERVFAFLKTDDFWRDYTHWRSLGVRFVREPSEQPYGTVAVFADPYGNLWDLLQHRT